MVTDCSEHPPSHTTPAHTWLQTTHNHNAISIVAGGGGPTVAENHSHQQQYRPITKLSAMLRPLLDPSRGLPARLSSIPLLVGSPHSSLTPLLLPLLLFFSTLALHSLQLASSFAPLYLLRLFPFPSNGYWWCD